MDYLRGLVPRLPRPLWEYFVPLICEDFTGVERFTLGPWGSLAEFRGPGNPGAVT